MIEWIHPTFFFFVAALLLPFVTEKAKPVLLLGMPLLAFLSLVYFPEGRYGEVSIMGMALTFGRVDRLSLVFGYIFTLITVIGMVYSLHVKKTGEYIAALLYAGSALGAVFAGDLLTLFLFWEAMAFSSVFLIFFGGNFAAGYRYILVHIAGGVSLLAGIVIYLAQGNDPAFTSFTQGVTMPAMGFGLGEMSLAPTLILIGFLVNAAVPPLHAWLADAYPESTPTGIVFLSAFTTKTAVYVLIRGFAGFTPLAALGAIMALYGVLYAMLENDIRRLLAYHIISQVGFMVAGVGIGTEMAINGATAHAFAHILYKALLMMGMSSVFFMTGQRKAHLLGGLYKTMPLTFFFYMIGGVSISGLPLFSGFISKSMTISAAAEAHMTPIYLLLMIASCGTFLSTTLKLPYAVFIADRGEKLLAPTTSDPPKNMLIGMGLAAFLCFLIGIWPSLLYRLLPFPVDYHPYSAQHIVGALQLLVMTALPFLLLIKIFHPHPTISLDTDWLYRKGGILFQRLAAGPIAALEAFVTEFYQNGVVRPMKHFMVFCRGFDIQVIDGIVNGVGEGAFGGSKISNWFEKYVVYGFINITGFANHVGAGILRRLQTGSVHNYAITIIIGIFLLVHIYFIYRNRV
jgi:multicomponent Na+:H+ antiporter subunit D